MTEMDGCCNMRITNLGYLIKEGLRGIFRHGFMSFAAVCVTVACLLIVGTFASVMYNLNIIVSDLNKTNEVLAYVDENLSDAEARSVGTLINRIDNVSKATFVSREEALENFIADYENPEAFAGTVADVSAMIRVAVTGKTNSPDLYSVMQILGYERTVARIRSSM